MEKRIENQNSQLNGYKQNIAVLQRKVEEQGVNMRSLRSNFGHT